jgi:hypothetical protein
MRNYAGGTTKVSTLREGIAITAAEICREWVFDGETRGFHSAGKDRVHKRSHDSPLSEKQCRAVDGHSVLKFIASAPWQDTQGHY